MHVSSWWNGLAGWFAGLCRRPASAPPAGSIPRGLPMPAAAPFHSRFGGRSWRYDADGVHAEGRLWRTAGQPVTCRAIMDLHGGHVLAAAHKHAVNPALIVMTIATETGALRRDGFTGPNSFRWEADVVNRDVPVPFNGSYSAGPMQILATTTRLLLSAHGRAYGLTYDPFAVAPALRSRPRPAPGAHPLYDVAVNIDLGTAWLRSQRGLTGDDPILVAAVYNSGGLYQTSANAWRLRSHGDHLDRAARWYGDACFVLRERGLFG